MQFFRVRLPVIVAFAGLLLVTPTWAQDWRDGSKYVRIQGGAALSSNRKVDPGSGGSGQLVFASGYNVSLAVGTALGSGLRAELEAAHFSFAIDQLGNDRVSERFNYITGFFNLGYDVPINDRVVAFGQMGLGLAYRFLAKIPLPAAPEPDAAPAPGADPAPTPPDSARFPDAIGLAYNVGGGFLYRLRSNVFVGPSYRFIWIGDQQGLSTNTFGHLINVDFQVLF